jgi:Barrel-sandwich domain of CusB or HlyD membrane-fusion
VPTHTDSTILPNGTVPIGIVGGAFARLGSNNCQPSVPIVPGYTLPPSSENASVTEGSAAPVKPALHRLVDFNRLLPDGTVGTLHSLLSTISAATKLDIYSGIQDGNRWTLSSSKPQSHRGESFSKCVISAIEEAADENNGCLFAVNEQQASMLQQACRQELSADRVIAFGISCKSTKVGLLIVNNSTSTLTTEQLSVLVKQIRIELAGWFELWHLCQQGACGQHWHSRLRRIYTNRRYWLLAVVAVVCSMAAPFPYWPERQCLVEPESRRFLASPIDGRVIEAQVRPGDVVEPNQLLARIDDESLRWELANVEADYQKSCKKKDSALATRSSADLRMAQLESEQFAIQIESLKSKLQQLEIRSPIAGVVVDGDWVPTSGTAVERSQTLFEIAPLDSMRIRTLLSTEDLGQIRTGTPVTVQVDAAMGKKWTGVIERIDPRGRLEGSNVVFEAETIVQNADQILRPGMQGSVRLTSGWHSLGWMIFHRPYNWLMKKLAW